MTTAEDIERAVAKLAPRELARFRAWFEAFDAEQFDAAIERDALAGKLDAPADDAFAVHPAGRKDRECEPTPEELAGIDRGLRDAAEGRFATDQQIETMFEKFRSK
jgi:predicted transcriptional regulator